VALIAALIVAVLAAVIAAKNRWMASQSAWR
jgi:hypothetical protein